MTTRMSDLVRDEESLLKLRTCPVCKTVVETLKVLSCCYYTICLPCTNSLTVHRSRFNCYNCNEEVLLPNGGFGYLPDSALTKLLTELDKQRITDNDSRSLTVEDLDPTKLRQSLENEIAAALRWINQAEYMRQRHADSRKLPLFGRLTTQPIKEHQQKISRQCLKKLAALTERLDTEREELEESITTLHTYNNTRKSVREVIHKIRSTVDVEDSFNHLSEAKQLLDKLSELHKKVKDLNSYLDSSVELEEGDSVRLNYNIKDKMEEFIKGNITHSSVGILVHKPKDNDDVAVVLFPEKYNWRGKCLSGLVKSLERSKLPFIDDKVQITTQHPHFGWNRLRSSSPGILKKIDHTKSAPGDDVVVCIDFPEVKNWKGLYSEIVTRDADEEQQALDKGYLQLCGSGILQQLTYIKGGVEALTAVKELVLFNGTDKVSNGKKKSGKKKVQPHSITPTAAELRSKLQQLHDEGAKWTRSSTDMTRRIRSILDSLPGKVLRTREAVHRYKTEIDERCEQKLYDEQIAVQDISVELGDYADLLRDHLKSISHAMQTCNRSLSTISAASVVDVSTLVQAQQCLLSLKAVNCKVRAICYGVDSFYEDKPGDCFRLVVNDFHDHTMSRYINGSLTLGSVGVLLEVFDETEDGKEMASVLFPDEKEPWIVPYMFVERILIERRVPYVGDKVVLKIKAITLELSLPSDESPDNTRCHGILKGMSLPEAEVKFPWQEEPWKGLYKDLELAPGCGFEVDDKVWVRRTIPEPTRGWGGVNGSSVGTVVKLIEGIEGEEEITVDFPECKDWVGLSTDLQLTRDAKRDDEVQVKLSVTEPRRGWQNYNHDSFGVLYRIEENGECASGFHCDRPFICDLDEIEPHRFQPPYYDIPQSERVDQGKFVSPAAMREYLLKCEAARRSYGSDAGSSSD